MDDRHRHARLIDGLIKRAPDPSVGFCAGWHGLEARGLKLGQELRVDFSLRV
jgi:hypothetical protein